MNNTTLVILVSLALLILGAVIVLKRRGAVTTGGEEEWPFYAKRPMTAPELQLYFRLLRALPEHIVLSQVQLSRVLGVKKGFNFNAWNNRINRLSYDFLVCGKDATVVAAVELDDRSHEAASRVEADARKTRATEAAGVKLVRWNVKLLPNDEEIRQVMIAPAEGLRIEPTLRDK